MGDTEGRETANGPETSLQSSSRLLYSARASRERYSNIATQLHTYVRERGEKEEAILTLLTYYLTCTYSAYAAAAASVRDFRK